MSYIKVLPIVLVTLFAVGCQQIDEEEEMERGMQSGAKSLNLVSDANGTLYEMSCLRASVQSIQQEGRTAMARCAVQMDSNGTPTDKMQRSRLFHANSNGRGGHAFYYWPPAFGSRFCSYAFGTDCWSSTILYDLFLFPQTYYTSYSPCDDCYWYNGTNYNFCARSCYRRYDISIWW